MNISVLLFLTYIIGSQACCPEKIEEKTSKECDACSECKYPNDDTKRSMDMWCTSPVCGAYTKMGFECPITYHGLCGLTKCAKGEMIGKGMCKDEGKPEESGPETDSMQCCKDMCPHKNEVLNKAHCENVVCGEDGRTYTGICALAECGKTKIECDGPCPCDGSSSEETEFPTSTPGMSTAGTATVSKLTTTDLPVTEEGVLPESPPPIYSDEDEDYDYSWCKPFCKKGMKKV